MFCNEGMEDPVAMRVAFAKLLSLGAIEAAGSAQCGLGQGLRPDR